MMLALLKPVLLLLLWPADGLKSPNDDMFAKSFSNVYDQGSLQVRQHSVTEVGRS